MAIDRLDTYDNYRLLVEIPGRFAATYNTKTAFMAAFSRQNILDNENPPAAINYTETNLLQAIADAITDGSVYGRSPLYVITDIPASDYNNADLKNQIIRIASTQQMPVSSCIAII
jgi:hypothetical protein